MAVRWLLLCLMIPLTLYAQPQIIWNRVSYEAGWQSVHDMCETSDGGFLLAGQSFDTTSWSDFWLLKLNAEGDSLWSRTYGSPLYEKCYSVSTTSDGRIILGGLVSDSGSTSDILVLFTSADGDSLTSWTYGGPLIDACHHAVETPTGDFILTGSYNDRWRVIHVNANGDSLWSRGQDWFGGMGEKVLALPDCSFVVAGWSWDSYQGSGFILAFISRISAQHAVLWNYAYYSPDWDLHQNRRFYSLIAASDPGQFVVAGTVDVEQRDFDILCSANGPICWEGHYPQAGDQELNDIIAAQGGGYAAIGTSQPPNDLYLSLLRVGPNGDLLWQLDVVDSVYRYGIALSQLADGGFLLAGNVYRFGGESDIALIRTAPDTILPRVLVTPEAFDFGYVAVRETVAVELSIRNAGLLPAVVNNVFASGPFWLDLPELPVTIEPGDSVAIQAQFAPSDSFDYAGLVEIWLQGADTLRVPLSGHGVYMPRLDWSRTVGRVWLDQIFEIQPAGDGHLLGIGRLNHPTDNFIGWEGWIVKVNALGDTLRHLQWGGWGEQEFRCGRVLPDQRLLVGGAYKTDNGFNTPYDYCLLELDSGFNVLSQHIYAGSGDDRIIAMDSTADGNWIFAGFEMAGTIPQARALKTDEHGDTLWTRSYRLTPGWVCSGITAVTADEMVLMGFGYSEMWLMGLNGEGDSLWTETRPRPTTSPFDVAAVSSWVDDGYLFVDRVAVPGRGADLLLLRLDAAGDSVWQRTYGTLGNDLVTGLTALPDGGFAIASDSPLSQSDRPGHHTVLFAVNAEGDSLWRREFPEVWESTAAAIQSLADGGVVIGGHARPQPDWMSGTHTGWLAKMLPAAWPSSTRLYSTALPARYSLYPAFPNPFNPRTTIAFDLPVAGMVKLAVYDLLGREVMVLEDRRLNAGTHQVTFDGSGLASGMYFYRLDAGAFRDTRKLLLLK